MINPDWKKRYGTYKTENILGPIAFLFTPGSEEILPSKSWLLNSIRPTYGVILRYLVQKVQLTSCGCSNQRVSEPFRRCSAGPEILPLFLWIYLSFFYLRILDSARPPTRMEFPWNSAAQNTKIKLYTTRWEIEFLFWIQWTITDRELFVDPQIIFQFTFFRFDQIIVGLTVGNISLFQIGWVYDERLHKKRASLPPGGGSLALCSQGNGKHLRSLRRPFSKWSKQVWTVR